MLWWKFSESTGRLSSTCGEVERVGTVSPNSLIGGRVIGINGICFTLMACTHGYGMGNFYDDRFIWLNKKSVLLRFLEHKKRSNKWKINQKG